MASIVATPDPATGSVLLEVNRLLLLDNFNRVTANGWGVADFGGTWTVNSGPAANFFTDGSDAQISLSATGLDYTTTIVPSGVNVADAELVVTFSLPVIPAGNRINYGTLMRTSVGGYYQARISFGSGADNFLSLSVLNSFGLFELSPSFLLPWTSTAPTDVSMRMAIAGDLIQARAWLTSGPEPDVWQVSAHNGDHAAGGMGIQAQRLPGNTNGTFNMTTQFVISGAGVEPLNLYRVTPDGTRTLVRGSGFFMPDPTAAVFWDNEAPFDVDIFYVLTSELSETAVVTSNTVNLDSGDDVWLRDPYNPSLNLVIEIDDEAFDYCTEDPKIMFSDLLGRVYASASGIFDIIDTQRPETIAQTRKRYGSTLVLTSKEPEDVTAIEAIIAGGYPLLLSLPVIYQFGLPYGTDWITVFDVDQQPVGVDRRVKARVWTLPFRLSLPPVDVDTGNSGGNGIGGGDATYDVLMASVIGVDYTTLAAAGLTFNQIAAGTGY